MGSAQQFSLRWNNYSHHITNALDDLRAEDELTDVTLCAEGNKIRAHKLLLSACSTFFRETFRENPCQHPVIILKGVSFIDLQAVVTFMYNGQVNVTQERLSCFLQTAEMLQIKGLTDMNDNKHQQDNDDMTSHHPLPPSSHTRSIPNANSAAKKRIIANNTSDSLQQRPPTPKRRKFIPSAPAAAAAQADGMSNNASSAYNSPGPSSNTNHGGGSVKLANSNADSNSADDYPGDVPSAVLKYEPTLHEDDGDGGALLGVEEEEFRNNLSDDGDNSMQDYTGVEQGAIDCDIGIGGVDRSGNGESIGVDYLQDDESTEAEVMVLEGGYDIIAYSDSEDVMPILSPPPTASAEVFKNFRSMRQHHQPPLLPPIDSSIASSTSHINILRRNKRPIASSYADNSPEEINPLADSDPAGSSRSSSLKPTSPFVGDPMMDPETGETMFPCLMCDKKYKLKSSLESHVKIHEGSENTCSICGQTMSRQRDLKRHVATVHRGLLMSDGSITYPPDIDELVPMRARKSRVRRSDNGGGSGGGGGGGWGSDQDGGSNDYFCLENMIIRTSE